MGVVYSARDTILDRSVALKFLPPDSTKDQQTLDRFLREARAAAALNHPNICTIHEIADFDGQHFIAMELMEGKTLKHMIEGRPLRSIAFWSSASRLPTLWMPRIRAASPIATSSQRIFLSRKRGQAKVLDFGLAKLTQQTQAGETVGASGRRNGGGR